MTYVHKDHRWTHGWPLFLLICAFATVPLYDRPLGVVAVLALVVICFTPAIGQKRARADAEDTPPAEGTL